MNSCPHPPALAPAGTANLYCQKSQPLSRKIMLPVPECCNIRPHGPAAPASQSLITPGRRPRRLAARLGWCRRTALGGVRRRRGRAAERDSCRLHRTRRYLRLHAARSHDPDARRHQAEDVDSHSSRRAARAHPADPHAVRRHRAHRAQRERAPRGGHRLERRGRRARSTRGLHPGAPGRARQARLGGRLPHDAPADRTSERRERSTTRPIPTTPSIGW